MVVPLGHFQKCLGCSLIVFTATSTPPIPTPVFISGSHFFPPVGPPLLPSKFLLSSVCMSSRRPFSHFRRGQVPCCIFSYEPVLLLLSTQHNCNLIPVLFVAQCLPQQNEILWERPYSSLLLHYQGKNTC